MAIDVCSEISSPLISPRISFSHDLKENKFDSNQARSDAFLLNSTIDFVFSIDKTFSQRLSSADEIFANGRILPVGIKKIQEPQPTLEHSDRPRKTEENTKNVKRLVEFLSSNSDTDIDEKPRPKPALQIGRSSSVNCENGRFLKLLTRSSSTGSAPNHKSKQQYSLKEESAALRKDSVVQSVNAYYNNTLKKSSSRSYGSTGIRFSPVLNIPPAYITKGTASLFGIGSFFCSKKSNKNKNNKKK